MKIKTMIVMAMAVCLCAACHKGKRPPKMDNGKLAISSPSQPRATRLSMDWRAWEALTPPWCCCPTRVETP